MALDLQTIQNVATEKIGFFRFKKFDDGTYIITNDAGRFHFLDENNFKAFALGKADTLDCYEELFKKGFIKHDEYQEKMTGSVVMRNAHVGVWPTLHMIVTTLRCNHKCRYCHAAVAPMEATQFDMTEETAKKVVDTIFYTNSPDLTIEFQGGESLVNYPIVQFITDYAAERAFHLKKNLSFSLVSNLTLMTEEKLTRLLDRNVDICTSLDGDEITHNHNRAGYDGNSFEKVTYWMKRVDEEKKKRNMWGVSALLTVTRETLKKNREIIDTYIKLGLTGVFLRWLNPYGFAAADMKTLAYDKDEWIQFYKDSLDYVIELNKKGTPFREYITTVYLQKMYHERDPNFMDIRSPSGIAIGGVAYNYDGKVYASDESRMLGRMGMEDFLMTEMLDDPKDTYTAMMNSDITKIAVQSSCLDGLPGYNDHPYKPYLWVDIIHNFKLTGSVYQPMKKDEKMQMQIAIIDYIFEKLRDPEAKQVLESWV